MKIKYTVPGLKETDNLLNVSKEKIFKIADGGTDDITKVTVEKITKIN